MTREGTRWIYSSSHFAVHMIHRHRGLTLEWTDFFTALVPDNHILEVEASRSHRRFDVFSVIQVLREGALEVAYHSVTLEEEEVLGDLVHEKSSESALETHTQTAQVRQKIQCIWR